MARRRRDDTQCTCPLRPAARKVTSKYDPTYTYTEHPNRCGGPCCADERDTAAHHFGCPCWGTVERNDSGNAFKGWRQQLGSPRTPYARWAAAATCSPYPWPLWRNFVYRPFEVESIAYVLKRQLGGKPSAPCTCEDHYELREAHDDKHELVTWRELVSCAHGGRTYPWKLWHQHKPAKPARAARKAAA